MGSEALEQNLEALAGPHQFLASLLCFPAAQLSLVLSCNTAQLQL